MTYAYPAVEFAADNNFRRVLRPQYTMKGKASRKQHRSLTNHINMEKQRCLDLSERQITPQSPVFTEEARRHKPQRFKILNIKNINNKFLT
jgi:hypothetical protein